MLVEHQNAVRAQLGMARWWQRQRVGKGLCIVRAGHDVKRERQVGGASGHRPDHRAVDVMAHRQDRHAGWREAARGNQSERRLVRENAATMCRDSQRAAEIRPQFERDESGCQHRCRSARRAAWRAAQVPRIVGGAVDRVEGLPVGELGTDVGLADDDGARVLEAADHDGVLSNVDLVRTRDAPCGGQSGDVEGLLDRHRKAEQGAPVAVQQRRVGPRRSHARPLEVANDHRVEIPRREPRFARWSDQAAPRRTLGAHAARRSVLLQS